MLIFLKDFYTVELDWLPKFLSRMELNKNKNFFTKENLILMEVKKSSKVAKT